LFDLAYLFDPRPGPLPPHDLQLHLALMGVYLIALGVSIYWAFFTRRSASLRWFALAQLGLSGVVLVLMASRLLAIPHLSTRLLLYGAIAVSALGWGVYASRRAHENGFLLRQLRLLTLSWQAEEPSTPWSAAPPLLLLHAVGLMFLSAQFARPYLLLVGLVVLLLSPQFVLSALRRKWTIHLEALTPLCFAYLAALARRACEEFLAQPLPLHDGFVYPEPVSALLSVEPIFFVSMLYVLLCQGYLLVLQRNRAGRYPTYVALGLLVLVSLWAGIAYFRHRTHGVTANDPYAYAQMAVDLAERGSPLHHFTLFPRISHLGISWWPVVHYGYQVRMPPLRPDGYTASDWPAGWPAILAAGYLLLGEEGLYLVNPVVGLLSLGAIVALVAELMHDRTWGERLLAGAFAAFGLATSYEQLDRLVVPMADASASLFTMLTLFLLLRGMRGRHRLYAVLAGFCLGWAYFIRHTQLAVGLCVVVALLYLGRDRLSIRQRWEFAGLFGVTAFLVAIPDLLYHQAVFGHFLTPESTELELFSLAHMPATARLMWQRALSGYEFGFLAPVMVWGAYRMYVEKRGEFLVLLTGTLGILAVHLPYEALRLRDLLSLFPILLAWVGYGAADLWGRVRPPGNVLGYRRYSLGVLILFALLLLPTLRTWPILPRAWGTYEASFGYVSAAQREGFEVLEANTVQPCVVGSSLNGGPIDLYTGREAFRPAFWSEEEWGLFVSQMFQEGTRVYILDDGEALRPSLDYARAHYTVTPGARVVVPIFGDPQKVSSMLYEISPRAEVGE
jgi:hypothetical protein